MKTKQKKKSTFKVPFLVSKNHSISPLRMRREYPSGDNRRYPLERWPWPVAIIHGSRTENAYARAKQALENGGVVLNHPDNIKNASNKVTSKKLFDKWEVPTTRWMEAKDLMVKSRWKTDAMTLNYPIVAKLKTGMGGKGMTLIQDKKELQAWRKKNSTIDQLNKYFFEECFNWGGSLEEHMKHTREYRLGVSPLLRGKLIEFTQVIVDDETGNTTEVKHSTRLGEIVALRKIMRSEAVKDGQFGRNLALGNSFFTRTFKREYNYKKRGVTMDFNEGIEVALRAVEALGLDYGAVDILWSSTTGEWNVIEVNTAPSMGSLDEGQSFTLNQWQRGFVEMIKAKKNFH